MYKLKIGICDDEPCICSEIESIIWKYFKEENEKAEITVFHSGEELCEFLRDENELDLLFLDIKLKTLNGVDVGRFIREEKDDQILQIVYISSMDTYMRELFEVRPMNFLSKPLSEDMIIHQICLAKKLLHKSNHIFIYKKGQETFQVPLQDIIYFESNNRAIKLVTIRGNDCFYGKLGDVMKQTGDKNFISPHKSYLVNRKHIMKFKYNQFHMSNHSVIPISQSKRKEMRKLQLEMLKETLI